MKKKLYAFLMEHPIPFYSLLLFGWFLLMCILNSIDGDNFRWHDLLVEANGMTFDLLIFGLIVSTYEARRALYREKRELIDKYSERIDDFRGIDDREVSLKVAKLIKRLNREGEHRIDLSNVSLGGVSLVGIKLMESNMTQAKLSYSQLNYANLSHVTLMGGTCKIVDFTNADLKYADLRNADFEGAIFTGANLLGANFEGANLKNAIFKGAYLDEVNFLNANLDGANLTGASTKNTKFD